MGETYLTIDIKYEKLKDNTYAVGESWKLFFWDKCDAWMSTLDTCIQQSTGSASERQYTRSKYKHVKQEGIMSFLFPFFCKIREQGGTE
jgi:hypothetical protein